MWDALIGNLISTGVLLALVSLAFKQFWGRIKDTLDKHDKAIDELFAKTNKNSEQIAFMRGKSNGKPCSE